MTTRNSKSKRPPTTIRGVVARNIAELRDKKYAFLPTVTDRNRQLAEDLESSLSQVQRIVGGKLGTSTDMIEQLASAFSVETFQLLMPYFSNNISEEFYAAKRARDRTRRPTTTPEKPAR